MASESAVLSSAPIANGSSKARALAVSHAATVEDVPDEDLSDLIRAGSSSGAETEPSESSAQPDKAAGKQADAGRKGGGIDTQSRDLFPELGAPRAAGTASTAGVWGARGGGGTPTNGASRSPTPVPVIPVAAAASAGSQGPVPIVIPGRNVESVTLEPQYILPRAQLKRPIPDMIKDINRKSRATISMVPSAGGRLRFDASGPPDIAQQALRDLVQQIGTKISVKVPIPQSARAYVIGRGGSTIKAIQDKTGAKIQLPKAEESAAPVDDGDDDDDDATIDVVVEGNNVAAASARDEILKIVGERGANVQTKLRGIPSEFFPFIAGPGNSLAAALGQAGGVQVRIPAHKAWASRVPAMPAPGQRPVFLPGNGESHIQLAGDRPAVQQARAEIERRVAELHEQLYLDQLSIQRGRHQFIIGDRGIPVDDFFADTGCAIILPTDEEDDMVTVVGPADKVPAGLEKAMDLALNMQCSNIDIARFHRNDPGGGAAHARNLTRYLRQRREFDRIEKLYSTHINTPFSQDGALPWELYSRDGKNAIRAQSEITGIVGGLPPSRIRSMDVNQFFFNHIRRVVTPRVRERFGVQVVVPGPSEPGLSVLLVYEDAGSPDDASYQVPRNPPSAQDVQDFRRYLEDAEKHIADLINKQEHVTCTDIEVSGKYHEKLKRFIKSEQAKQDGDQIPARVSSSGTKVILRGPASAVESLAAKVNAFIEQEKQDEKERDYTTSFDFPQKFADRLIGKGGSRIRELRERFDVEIQVQDGRVDVKGPKAKADSCKAFIANLSRSLADETIHVMKIDPKFHGEIIGPHGSQINRLQDRYKVAINFPKSARPAGDDQANADASSEPGAAGKPRRQSGADEVVIRGPRQGADGARDEIFALHNFLKENSHTATVAVRRKHLPALIGQGGMALDDLRQSTGARIDVPGGGDDEVVEIQLKGTKAQVEAARKATEAKRAVLDDTVVREIEVERKHHKALIGHNGTTLRAIVTEAGGSDDRREMSRAIQFPKHESGSNIIRLEGRSAVVDKIVAKIQEMVAERASQVTEVIDVPVAKHRTLVGRGGDTRRQLESRFTVTIDIPRQGEGKTHVRLTGQAANVQQAKAHISELVKEQEGEAVQVPRRLHASISNNGQFFRKLRSDLHVSVDHAGHPTPRKPAQPLRTNGSSAPPLITDDPSASADVHSWHVVDSISTEEGDIPWVLRGSAENVEKAKKAIQVAIQQAEKQGSVGYLTLPDSKTYRHVIGSGGSKVNAIRKQSQCRITVPREQDQEDAIEVVGTREDIEKAKDLILAAVKEGISQSRSRSRDRSG